MVSSMPSGSYTLFTYTYPVGQVATLKHSFFATQSRPSVVKPLTSLPLILHFPSFTLQLMFLILMGISSYYYPYMFQAKIKSDILVQRLKPDENSTWQKEIFNHYKLVLSGKIIKLCSKSYKVIIICVVIQRCPEY